MLTDGMLSQRKCLADAADGDVETRPKVRRSACQSGVGHRQETAKQERGKLQPPPQRLAHARLSLSRILYFARERADFPAYPFMAFVAVIARMPEQPQRKADAPE